MMEPQPKKYAIISEIGFTTLASRETPLYRRVSRHWSNVEYKFGAIALKGDVAMVTASARVCPRCGQIDAVRKVSSIVSEGITTTPYQGISPLQLGDKTYLLPALREMTFSTLLTKRLVAQLPEKPKGVSWIRYLEKLPERYQRIGYLNILLGLAIFGMIVTISVIVGAGFGYLLYTPSPYGRPVIEVMFTTAFCFGCPLSLTLLGVYMILERRYFVEKVPVLKENYIFRNEREARAKRRAEQEYQAGLAKYNRALEKWWNYVYYCSRDDGVFTTGSHLVPVEQMRVLLYA